MANQSVLIVDDDFNTSKLYAGFLKESGISTHACGSGEEALSRLSKHPVNALVTDMHMPGMDGMELLRAVKKLHRGTRVLVMSGRELNTAELKLQGAMDVLAKPVPLTMFYAAVTSALAEQRTTRRLPFQVPVRVEGTVGASIDVSAEGMLVKSESQLPFGRDLGVEFGAGAAVESFSARVLRSRTINSLYYSALQFADIVGEGLVRHVRGAWAPLPA